MTANLARFPQGLAAPFLFLGNSNGNQKFATLPVAATAGWVSYIVDASTAVPGAIVAGGGSIKTLVYYDGASWRVLGGDAEGSEAADFGQYTAITGTTWTAANIAGAQFVTLATSGATALTTPAASAIIAAIPNAATGANYVLRIYNTNAGTLTLTAGGAVTITGTATIATNVYREYLVTMTSGTAVTFQNLGSGVAN